MKSLLVVCAVLSGWSVCWAGSDAAMDRFNDRKMSGWSPWSSSDAKCPTMGISKDAAEGSGSLIVKFPKSGETSLVARTGFSIPSSADAISMWVKRVSGSPACVLILEEDPRLCPEGADAFRVSLPQAGDEWSRVVIPLKEFSFVSAKNGAGNQKLDREKVYKLYICAYHQPAFAMGIDCVEFITMPKVADEVRSTTKNVLGGDPSFETGVMAWTSYILPELPMQDTTTGVVGSCSMKLSETLGGIGSGWRIGMVKAGRSHVLSFYAKSAGVERIACTVMTEDWKYLAASEFALGSTWQRFELKVSSRSTAENAYVVFGKVGGKGTLWIDAVQLEEGDVASAYESPDAMCLSATSGAAGEVVMLAKDQPLVLKLSAFNARCGKEMLPVSLHIRVSEISTGLVCEKTATLSPAIGEGWRDDLVVLPKMAAGYYVASLTLRDRTGQVVKTIDCPVAVVRGSSIGSPDESFLGMHPNYVPLDALWATGIRWLRGPGGDHWCAGEAEQGKIHASAIADPRVLRFGLFGLLMISPPPTWAKSSDPTMPTKAEMIVPYMRELVKYGRPGMCYDLQNEPDLTFGVDKAAGAKMYAQILKAVHPFFVATNQKLAFDGSGDGFGYAEAVMRDAPKSFDIFSPHPYPAVRYLGPNGSAMGPEQGGVKEKMVKAAAMIKSHGGGQELWIGELGWGLDVSESIDSAYAVRQAAYVSRTHILARSVPQLKRVIWFTSLGCIEGNRYEYGLWRNDEGVKPLPAVAAYATIASLLDGAKPLPIISDGEIRIYPFTQGDRTVVAVWDASSNEPDEPLSVEVPRTLASVLTFSGADVPIVDDVATMKISATPSFAVMTSSALQPFAAKIRDAIQNRRPINVSVSAVNVKMLDISIDNCTNIVFAGGMDVAIVPSGGPSVPVASTKEIRVSPEGRSVYRIALNAPIDVGGATLQIEVRPSQNASNRPIAFRRTIPPMRKCMPHRDATTVSSEANAIRLERREDIYPADPTVRWEGSADLSVQASVTWDASYVYFDADVIDDKHVQPFVGRDVWLGDSIQLAIDTRNDARDVPGYDSNDYEYGVSLGQEGRPTLWRWTAAAGVSSECEVLSAKTVVTRVGTHTQYRVAIPWSELTPMAPTVGNVFGLSFIVNDNDGDGRKCWAGLSNGISECKRPSLFSKFVLSEE